MSRWIIGSVLATAIAWSLVAAPPEKDASGGGNVYKKSIKSVTWIVQPVDDNTYRSGTGSLIDRNDKLVITNYHVVGDADSVNVMFPTYDGASIVTDRNKYLAGVRNGTVAKGKVLAREPKRDLAILKLDKIPNDAPGIHLAKDGIGTGDRIHCIGNPGVSGGLWSYTPGDVKNVFNQKFRTGARNNPRDGFEIDAKMIENTALTNEGDSGGPVLNGAGDLVGVTQGYRGQDARGVSYAVDLSEVKAFLKANKYGRLLNAPANSATAAAETPVESPPAAAAPPADNKPDAAKQQQIAATKLTFAKDLIRNNKKDRAKERLEEIVKDYPDTPAATEARQLLESLK